MKFRKGLAVNGDTAIEAETPRRLTRDLLRAFELAVMLTHSRASETIEVSDLLGAMYIDNWDHMKRFWPDPLEAEKTMRKMCEFSPSRWDYWIKTYNETRDDQPRKKWFGVPIPPMRRAGGKDQGLFFGKDFELSEQLRAALKAADKIAPYQDRVGERTIPIVSSDCVLLCLVKNTTSDVARKLLATGIDLRALEKAARFPKYAPI
jgi:hypothetical protein